MSDLKQRVISSVIGVLIFIPFVMFNVKIFAALLAAIGILCAYELVAILRKLYFSPFPLTIFFSVFLLIYLPAFLNEYGTMLALIFLVVVAAVLAVFSKNKIANGSATLFCSLYIGFLLSRLVMLRQIEDGVALTLFILVSIWVSDIAAYFIGKNFGKRRFAPNVSPGKTWEGTIAGIIFAVAVSPVFIYFTQFKIYELMIVSLFVSVAGLLGDLFESQFKRWAGVKDSGQLIPGHGGFLDRFDSLLFGGAVGYYVIQLFLL